MRRRACAYLLLLLLLLSRQAACSAKFIARQSALPYLRAGRHQLRIPAALLSTERLTRSCVDRVAAHCTKDKGIVKYSSASECSQPIKYNALGIPSKLLPVFVVLTLDAAAAGLLAPILPYYIGSFGARAIETSAIISATYACQAIGCLFMSRVSGVIGRKNVILVYLAMSCFSYLALSSVTSLRGVLLARLLAGSAGGLAPLVQACALDHCSGADQTAALLGRVQAASIVGFIAGPLLGVAAGQFPGRWRICLCAFFPLLGFLIASLAFRTSPLISAHIPPVVHQLDKTSVTNSNNAINYLYISGFLVMLAASTEGVYPLILEKSFGLGERALAALFAGSGIAVLLLQYFCVALLQQKFGLVNLMVFGNALLSIGLLGIAFIRSKNFAAAHFFCFFLHLIGFSLSDTAVVSLISSLNSNQVESGVDSLAYLQTVQAIARIGSPILTAFILYISAQKDISLLLPVGSAIYGTNSILAVLAILSARCIDSES